MKKFLSCISISFFTLFWVLDGYSQPMPLNLDFASYRHEENADHVEFYMSFYYSALKFVETDTGYIAQFDIRLTISRDDSILAQGEKSFEVISDISSEEARGKQVLDIFAFELPPGEYTAELVVNDINAAASKEFISNFEVKPFPDSQMSLSDLLLCSHISPAQGESYFNKHSLRVMPNPSRMFGIAVPVVYYYAELYNLPAGSPYWVETFITDKDGDTVRVFPKKEQQHEGIFGVLVGGHNIIALPADAYFFHVRVTDPKTGDQVEETRRFTLHKPGREKSDDTPLADTPEEPLRQIYRGYTEEELDEEFDAAEYIAAKEEKNIYSQLDLEGKKKFMAEFWKRRNPNPGVSGNEYREAYLRNIQFANQHFSTQFKEGWRSDRGRVLLVYGVPDEIERFPMQVDMRPYEIWYYNQLEGGCYFVFADLSGFGEYILLHSTYSGELYQPDWEQMVRKTTGIRSDGF